MSPKAKKELVDATFSPPSIFLLLKEFYKKEEDGFF